ncbi:MAG: RnfABCDGE type electron transport complex subunit G [bacterium]|nr:RnfABCDGE type electron transport complex subunit G [bacterium]
MAEGKKKKLESTFFNMVFVLSVIALVSALALGFTYTATKDAIAQVEVDRTLKALGIVLPEFNNNPYEERYNPPDDAELVIYPAQKEGQPVGTAIKTYTDKGFSERIWLMVGFDKDNKINDISVLKHKETPGLGTKMKDPKFKDQFKGIDPASFKMTVTKDGGEVDAISAATISSRAFCDAAQRAYDTLIKGGKKQEVQQ